METLKAVSDRLFPKGADGKWAHFRDILFLPWSKRRGNLLLRNCAVNVPVNKQWNYNPYEDYYNVGSTKEFISCFNLLEPGENIPWSRSSGSNAAIFLFGEQAK